MKPSDFFLGVIDFFSTLVPGAIGAFFLITELTVPCWWPHIKRGSAEGWVVFLVSAYVLGHVIAAVGSIVLDYLYDRFYARWRRTSSDYVRRRLTPGASIYFVTLARIQHVLSKSNPDDELLATARALKVQQLAEVALISKTPVGDITNTYWWASTVVRLKTPDGAAEVDALSAQSKLFRGVVVLILLMASWIDSARLVSIWIWILMLALSLWRFMYLRWSATERTYEYFIATSIIPGASKADEPAA